MPVENGAGYLNERTRNLLVEAARRSTTMSDRFSPAVLAKAVGWLPYWQTIGTQERDYEEREAARVLERELSRLQRIERAAAEYLAAMENPSPGQYECWDTRIALRDALNGDTS